ncbi:MAG: VWA domain-containing protein [Candidatus Eisenbacteria bacterium]|uniref:VWA domain-containing protein n=1 Tax=Eiseniibacteriota bacterium TaxID=2212470 RepID=A0A956RPF9_UNCEI|nr:VWA domain-containing protein [Candidatus Eisenbacteria bacterium]
MADQFSMQLLSAHLWRWVLLLIPAIALAFWSYHGLLAPLSRPARASLWLLRGLAFLLVLFALWQPVVTVRSPASGKPTLAVLLDRSGSMTLPASSPKYGSNRGEEVAKAATELDQSLSDRYRLRWYGFRNDLEPAQPDSSPAGGTSIGQALEEVLTRSASDPVSGVVLVSDGVHTQGRDPLRVARVAPVPVFTIGVGPERSVSDLEIRRVQTNRRAFAGEPLPLRVVLSSSGLQGKSVLVEVRSGDRVEESRSVTIEGGQGLEQELSFDLEPHQPGLVLYDVTASVEGDSIPENNHRQFAVDVQDRKTQVLCVADAIDWDFGFLRRALEADTTLAYSFLVRTGSQGFRALPGSRLDALPTSPAQLSDFAAVLLVSTEAKWPGEFLNATARFVHQGGGLLLMGTAPQAGSSTELARILPADLLPATGRGSGNPVSMRLTAQGMRHPVTQLRDSPAENTQIFASLPPIWRTAGGLKPRGAGRSLLDFQTSGNETNSAFAVGFAERGKCAWLAGRGWWRWSLTAAGSGGNDRLYRDFVGGLVRWLAEPAVRDRFHVEPGKRVYASGESSQFAASLYDATFAPVEGAVVELQVFGAGDSLHTPLARIPLSAAGEPGSYEGEGPSLPPGAYRFEATARAAESNADLGTADGPFWIEPMGPEFARTGSDRDLLRQISSQSHGRSADLASISDLVQAIPTAIRQILRVREIELWNHWLLFALFVLVLSTEWFLRRRRGLA